MPGLGEVAANAREFKGFVEEDDQSLRMGARRKCKTYSVEETYPPVRSAIPLRHFLRSLWSLSALKHILIPLLCLTCGRKVCLKPGERIVCTLARDPLFFRPRKSLGGLFCFEGVAKSQVASGG